MPAFTRRQLVASAIGALPALHAASARAAPGPLARLDEATRGPLLRPGHQLFSRTTLLANARFDEIRPRAALVARDAEDVRQAVLWSARTGIELAPRAGGHSYGGYSTTDTGVMLDVRGLDRIVPHADGSVTLGAGVLQVAAVSKLAALGRGIVTGSCPSTSVVGVGLGGGYGLASRRYGLACDRVVSLRVVTADGRLRLCDAKQNADLFWALRGGGGRTFGIVTHATVRSFAAGTASRFVAAFPWSDAGAVVRAWLTWAPEVDPRLTSICRLSTGSTGPSVRVFGEFIGSEAALRRSLTGLISAATPTSLTTAGEGWLDLQLRWAGCLGKPAADCAAPSHDRFAAASQYLDRKLTDNGARTLVEAIEARQDDPTGSGAILLDAYGGAIHTVAPDATAFVHRGQRASAQYLAYFGAAGDAGALRWLRDTRRAARPHVSGAAYQNYVDPALEGWRQAYYGGNLERLRSIKRSRDPDHVFRFAQGL